MQNQNLQPPPLPTKKLLRTKIRAQRRALSPLQQKRACQTLGKQLERSLALLKARHIALYFGSDGEICPVHLIPHLLKRKKILYMPVLHPFKKSHLVFCRITSSTKLKKNRFGIPEPSFKHCSSISAKHLSLVLLPLVAFDKAGNRMGMGGGYYDRAFDFKRKSARHSPRMIGLAHELQRQKKLPTEDWDIPLFAIFTDKKTYYAS